MVSHFELSEFLIAYCSRNDTIITNKKLQKIVYYCEAWHLAVQKESLIKADFEAWAHGAVIRSLYALYADNRYDPITLNDADIDGIIERFRISTHPESLKIIDKVISRYINLSADDLEQLNHCEYPWIAARNGLPDGAHCTNIIDKQNILDYYSIRALREGMKPLKYDVYKPSKEALKKAQNRIRQKTPCVKTEAERKARDRFVLDSYLACVDSIDRAEYGR